MPEMAKAVRSITKIPMDVHMMTNNPEPYIKDFVEAGVNIIAVHVEDNPNIHRTIKMIKDS
jgi:ribulose-phosphate 3-epimerase